MQTTELTLTERKAQVAQMFGVAPDSVRSVQLQLDVLRQQGLLIDLNIKGTTMFTKTATWSEYGVSPDDTRASALTKGNKHIIPDDKVKAIKSVEIRMRQLLNKLTYGVTGFSPYRWLPFTAYEEWREKFGALQDELEQIKASIIAQRDDYVDSMADTFARIAEEGYRSIVAQDYKWAIYKGRAMDREEFISAVVEDAVSQIPTVEEIITGLQADYVTALVASVADIEAENLRAAELKALAREMENEQYIRETEELERIRHERKLNQLAEQEREAKIQAMMEAEAEHARQKLQEIASHFEEIFTALRRQMADDAREMLASIEKNGFLRGKVAEKGRGLIEVFNLLAVQNDYELRSQLAALREAIGPVGKTRNKDDERDVEAVKAALSKIADLERQAVEDLLSGPNRFSVAEF